MSLRNLDISMELSIPEDILARRCRKLFICWISREILMHEFDNLYKEDREILIRILKTLCTISINFGNGANDLFNEQLIVFKEPTLNRLAKRYAAKNPFGVIFN